MKRTKGIRQKQGSNSYATFVPFGTDGQFVDMTSELNLEYELKLGPKHYARIEEDEANDVTYITQEYATPEESSNDNNDYNNFSFYRTVTKITSINSSDQSEDVILTDKIEMNLYWVSRTEGVDTPVFIKGKETLIFTIVIVHPSEGQSGQYKTEIQERYYTEERDLNPPVEEEFNLPEEEESES